MKVQEVLAKLEQNSIRMPFSGCQVWLGSVADHGYGRIRIDGVLHKVHRLSYEIHKGEIPSGLLVCHTCDVRCCLNPEHLFLGTNQDNRIDASNKGRLHVEFCKNGHPATPENRYMYTGTTKGSYCKVCRRVSTN